MKQTIPRKRAAIIGSGSIGMDLMCKVMRSPHLDLRMVVGRSPNSEGLAKLSKIIQPAVTKQLG